MNRRIGPYVWVNVTITHAEWLAISAAIAKPWPPEAVRIDLDMREQLDQCDRDALGRSTCMERWGWSQKQVRSAFEGHGPAARR